MSSYSRTQRHRRLAFGGGLLTSVSLLVVSAAAAQSAPAPQRAAAAQSTQLNEVIVTAEKRSENIQNVPASVTALPSQKLAKQGLVRFEDYAAQVPGLSFSSTGEGNAQLVIRGITTGVAQSATTTAIYVDEAPFGSVNAYGHGTNLTPDLDPAELSQIEVLKGPQGTLYGAGALGGLVKFDTAPVSLSHFGGAGTVGGDSVDHGGDGYTLRAMANVPIINDQLGVRISGFSREDPGYIDNVTGKSDNNDTRVYGGRGDLLWKPNDHISVDLWAMGQDIRDEGPPDEDVNATTLQPIYGNLKTQAYIEQPELTQFRIYNATVKGEWGPFNVTSSTTYETIKSYALTDDSASLGPVVTKLSGKPNGGAAESLLVHTNRIAQEVRLNSTAFDGKLDYQFGFYFTHESDVLQVPGVFPFNTVTKQPITLAPAFTPLLNANIFSTYTEYSGFANATYHFTSQFDVLAGVRYSQDYQTYFQNYHGALIGAPIILSSDANNGTATYLVSPRFKINDDNMVYARISSGYRPGGPNAVPGGSIGAPATFAPDTITSYEAGYKSELLDRSMTVDLALYYTDWQHIQIETNAVIAGVNHNYFVNGGSATSEGVELAVAYRPLPGLTLGLNGAFTDAFLTSPAPAAGGRNGDELPFVPKWSGSVSAAYTWTIVDSWDGNVGGSVNYTGDRISNFSQHGGVPVPGYTTVNINAGVDHGRYSLNFYIKNLTDAIGITYLGVEPTVTTAIDNAAIIQPRTYGAELSVRF
jgi:outer membrane receptor protein involved in Fe transport